MGSRLACIASLCFILCASPMVGEASGVWLDVPFVRQPKQGCGSAVIAMVMQYWGREQGRPPGQDADAAQIQRVLFSRPAKGIYAADLERYLQQQGYRTFAFRGQWADLSQHLQKGRPLIVALQPTAGSAALHYVVVTGLDWDQGLVLVNDPAQRKLLKQDRATFERQLVGPRSWSTRSRTI